MALDQRYEHQVQAWLQTKQVVHACPACQAEDWVILELVDAPVRWPPELHAGGPDFLMVPRGCRTCGYLMFFSAAKIGLHAGTDAEPHDHEPDESGSGPG